jgi:hypothetical protein
VRRGESLGSACILRNNCIARIYCPEYYFTRIVDAVRKVSQGLTCIYVLHTRILHYRPVSLDNEYNMIWVTVSISCFTTEVWTWLGSTVLNHCIKNKWRRFNVVFNVQCVPSDAFRKRSGKVTSRECGCAPAQVLSCRLLTSDGPGSSLGTLMCDSWLAKRHWGKISQSI